MASNNPVKQLVPVDNSNSQIKNDQSYSDVFRVIEAVKVRPVIWKSELYGDRIARPEAVDAVWEALYKQIDPLAEKKLSHYRHLWYQVRKDLEEQFPSDLLIEHYRRHWKYFKAMEFYYYEMCDKRYKINYIKPAQQEQPEEESEESEEETEPNFAEMRIGKEHTELVWRYILMKRITKTAPGDQLLDVMDTICDTALNQLNRKQQK